MIPNKISAQYAMQFSDFCELLIGQGLESVLLNIAVFVPFIFTDPSVTKKRRKGCKHLYYNDIYVFYLEYRKK